MTEEQIIKQIKLHPILYNIRLSEYRDLEMRNIAWEEIARKVNSNVEDIKTKWNKLRNCYTNALKRRRKKNDQDANRIMPWKFETQMDFLIPHLKYRYKNFKPDVTVVVDDSIKDESLSSFNEEFDSQFERAISPVSSTKYVSPIMDNLDTSVNTHHTQNMDDHVLKDYVNVMNTSSEIKVKGLSVEMDENDYFFLSMSKILKKLPEDDQADIKFELHKLIYEAEKKQRKNNCIH